MRRRTTAIAALLALALAIPAQRGEAETLPADGTSEGFGNKKFWDYAMCGASIVFAAGTGGWILTALTCGRAITEHWTE